MGGGSSMKTRLECSMKPERVIKSICAASYAITNFGGSPDGLVGEDGIIEIKCPYSRKNYVEYLYWKRGRDLKKKTEPEYYTQIQGEPDRNKSKNGVIS